MVGFFSFFFSSLLFLRFSFRSAGESKLETIEDDDVTLRLWEESIGSSGLSSSLQSSPVLSSRVVTTVTLSDSASLG